MISLLTFIQTGRLGEIGLSSTRTEVELAFGPPDEWDSRFSFPNAPIWKYGNIEIYFEHELVSMIYYESSKVPFMGQFDFDPWKLRPGISMDEMATWLQQEDVPFEAGWGEVEIRNDEGSWWLALADGHVTLRFDDDGEGKRLSSFWCAV